MGKKIVQILLVMATFPALAQLKPLSFTQWDEEQWELQSDIVDIDVLKEIEKSGFSMAHLFGAAPSQINKVPTNKEFFEKSAPYRSLVKLLWEDLRDSERTLKKNVDPRSVGVSLQQFTHRTFHPGWFESVYSHYELVGVINRMDRVSFEVGSQNDRHNCGELRFIYRLAYNKSAEAIASVEGGRPRSFVEQGFSRLPLTVNLIFHSNDEKGPEDGVTMQNGSRDPYYMCRMQARNWILPKTLKGKELAKWIVDSGPLSPENYSPARLKLVEYNFQAFRTPSTAKKDTGGQAEYVLRVFKKDPSTGHFVRGYLENTPDVEKINNDPKLKKELLDYLYDHYKQINMGVLNLPEKFLATKASSFSPYGISRLYNRLFDQIFDEKDFVPLFKNLEETMGENWMDRKLIRSSSAMMIRLNDMTCTGCHQARATAGFHFVGRDLIVPTPFSLGSSYYNSIIFEGSGHYAREKARRKIYLSDVVRFKQVNPFRELSISPAFSAKFITGTGVERYHRASQGDFCGLKNGAFPEWQCDKGLECVQMDEVEGDKNLGKCRALDIRVGEACAVGSFKTGTNPFKDKLTQNLIPDTSRLKCQKPEGGFPAGMFANWPRGCDNLKPGEVCSQLAVGDFSKCLASNDTGFMKCQEDTAGFSGRAFCNEDYPCRNDYICVSTKPGSRAVLPPGSKTTLDKPYGACAPTYFVFQFRVDGHGNPWSPKKYDETPGRGKHDFGWIETREW